MVNVKDILAFRTLDLSFFILPRNPLWTLHRDPNLKVLMGPPQSNPSAPVI